MKLAMSSYKISHALRAIMQTCRIFWLISTARESF